MRKVCLAFSFILGSWIQLSGQWQYQGTTTPTWPEVISRYKEMDRAHAGAKLMEIGHDDDGSPLHLFVISDGSGFTPDSIRRSNKNILWITNGIHPGEPDGIDASLLLAQALLDSDQYMGLLAKTAVCIVPVYNVNGSKQRSATSRANQNGPAEYGFRGNARNLDLNRDFIKMDAENTRGMVAALRYWDPDVYFETHVSNGADHQYVMELLTTQKDKLDPSLSAFMTSTMVPELHAWMDRKEILMCPYFETLKDVPDSGLYAFYDSPRYSTGYNALFDRIGILSESHMLKPYADRVNATLQLLFATLATMDRHGDELKEKREVARARAAGMEAIGLNWTLDSTAWEKLPWKGWAARYETSAVSGLQRLRYDPDEPTDGTVPWNDTYRPTFVKRKPVAYVVPQQWHEAIARLQANGVPMVRLERDSSFTCEQDSIGTFTTVNTPYEGHYLHRDVRTATKRIMIRVRQGDFLIPTGHRTDRYVMETLEPEAEDSFFAWGFFDSGLQQKEWFSDYVFEDIAAKLLATDPVLKAALEAKRASDPAFAKDAWAQLYFVYQCSPYFEATYRRYPVLRIVDR